MMKDYMGNPINHYGKRQNEEDIALNNKVSEQIQERQAANKKTLENIKIGLAQQEQARIIQEKERQLKDLIEYAVIPAVITELVEAPAESAVDVAKREAQQKLEAQISILKGDSI